MTARHVLSLIGCTLMLNGCSAAPGSAPTAPSAPTSAVVPQRFTLAGTLLLSGAAGTRGVAGQLQIELNSPDGFVQRLIDTGPDGRYVVPDLLRGTRVNVRLISLVERVTNLSQPGAVWTTMDSDKTANLEVLSPGGVQTFSGSPILSGVVYRNSAAGRQPVPDLSLLFDWQCDDGLLDASTTSDAEGRYSFCNLPAGHSCVYTLSTAYRFQSLPVGVRGNTTLDINADPPAPPPPPNIDGSYSLEIETDCAAVPPAWRRRTYTATLTGSPRPFATLSGATFWSHPSGTVLNTFSGEVRSGSVGFRLAAPQQQDFGIVERTDPTSLLEFVGLVEATITGTTIEGPLVAGVGFGEDLRDDRRHAGCTPGQHRATFRLTRQ